jgi:hypothetical protein
MRYRGFRLSQCHSCFGPKRAQPRSTNARESKFSRVTVSVPSPLSSRTSSSTSRRTESTVRPATNSNVAQGSRIEPPVAESGGRQKAFCGTAGFGNCDTGANTSPPQDGPDRIVHYVRSHCTAQPETRHRSVEARTQPRASHDGQGLRPVTRRPAPRTIELQRMAFLPQTVDPASSLFP